MDPVEKIDCRVKDEVIWGGRKPLQPHFYEMPSLLIQMDHDKTWPALSGHSVQEQPK
jgi:hypothetical protein